MKIPGPDHPITVTLNPKRVRARIDGHVIADTTEAMSLQEASYPAMNYFPRKDVEMGFFAKTALHTACPFKGEASYYTITIDGNVMENVVWSYEDPYPHMQAIKELIAFYPDKVEVYEVEDEA